MKKFSSWIFITLILLLVIVSAVIVNLWVTVKGIGLTSDSTIYLSTAKNLLEGKGFFAFGEPMTQYPPVYPLVLAAIGRFNPDISEAARMLHAFLYGLNGALFLLIVYVATKRSPFAIFAAGILYFSNEYMLDVHVYAWSESPFITFLLLAVLCLTKYVTSQRINWLYLTATALALTAATRYVGIIFLLPVLITYWLFSEMALKRRVKYALVFSGISVLPLAAWLVRNLVVAKTAANRVMSYHPVNADGYHDLISSLHNYFLPATVTWWNNLIELAVVFIIFSIIGYRLIQQQIPGYNKRSAAIALALTGLLASIVYIAFLIISMTYFDAMTIFNHRILSPVFVLLSLSVVSIMFAYSRKTNNKSVWTVFLLCVLLLGRANMVSTVDAAFFKRANGLGLNGEIFHKSPLLSKLPQVNKDILIYSNGFREIGFLSGNETKTLPQKYDAMSKVENTAYQSQMDDMCTHVKNGEALIVAFRLLGSWDIYPTEDEIDKTCNLPILYDGYDGLIFGNNDKIFVSP